MKRAVLCVPNPQDYIDQLDDYSIMIVNPASSQKRLEYLFDRADWSLKITDTGVEHRDGSDYANERLFWYTSGTTGDSKFCSFSQAQLDIMSATILRAYDITANDRYVSIMPLWHAHGQGFFWATRQANCEVHFLSVSNIKRMADFSPTFVTAIPDFLKVIGTLKFDHLRFLRSNSAPLPNSLFQDLKQKHAVPIIEAFGMTETLSHCFTNPLHGEQRMGTIGLPDGINAQIRNGELWVSGDCVFTAEWYNTGDLAEQDSAGYYRILGRSRDQLNIKGKKFNPSSLESQVLKQFPAVTQCVIFGDQQLSCLYVGECSEQQIKTYLCELDPQLRPALLQQVSEIPVQIAGKISRSYLKSLFGSK